MSAQQPPALATPQRINTDTTGQQVLRAVGTLRGGGTSIAWLSQSAGSTSVQAQRFDRNGARADAPLQVPIDASVTDAAVTVLPDGGLVVATVRIGPASEAQPWVTRTALAVRRYDASGAPAGDARELAAVLHDRTSASAVRWVAQPQLRAWDDGGWIATWAVVTEDAGGKVPQFFAQRFDAAGHAGAASDLGAGASDSTLQVATSPAGGWYAATASRVMGRTFLRFQGFDGAVAPQLPTGALGMAEGSVLLPLQDGGTALLVPAQVYGTLQVYDAAGQARSAATGLRTMPLAAVALREGGFVLVEAMAAGTDLAARRYTAAGTPAGAAAQVASAGNTPLLAAMPGGALMAAWTSTTAGDQDVMGQQVQP